MSTRTYTTTIHGRTIELKLKKDLAKAVAGAIKKAFEVNGHWIEVTGVIGGEEHSSQLWTPFGGAPVSVADPAQYEADCNELLQSLPDVITMENCQQYVKASKAVFAKHLPIDDQRTTPEVHAAEVAKSNAQIKEHEDQRAAFIGAMVAKYGNSPDPVEVPEGYTPVVIELNYNDSDSMSDYFDRHHSYGPQFLLALVKGRPARTEKMHRDIIAKYPELSALQWTWNTENYSMGHGNWLESEAVGTAEDVTTYGGHTAPAVWWEVSYGWDKKLYPFHGYGASQNAPSTQEAAPAPRGVYEPGLYELTFERDWSWLKFPSKPTPEVLDTLRTHGGRWGKRRGAWYFTRHLTEAEVTSWLGFTAPEPAPDPVSQMVETALSLEAFTPEPAPDDGSMPEGTRIYYTGDMANISGDGEIVKVTRGGRFYPLTYDIRLDDGRLFNGVLPNSFDDSPGRRFWTTAEWEAKQQAQLKAFADRYGLTLQSEETPEPAPDPVIVPTMEDITEGNPESAPVIVPPTMERNSAGALITEGLREEWNKMQEFIAQDPTPAPSPAPSVEMHPSRFANFE